MNSYFPKFPWQTLLEWYKTNGRHTLPWRNYSYESKDLTYRIWLSEIFLQQTQVSRVIEYFESVVQRFPNIESLAATDYETFFPYYQGLGYYSRARNILKTAKIVSDTHHGILPKDIQQLKKLPGIGSYTASAILAFGYGEPHLAWDTNLEKVFARYYNGSKGRKLSEEEKQRIEKDFSSFVVHPDEKNGRQERTCDRSEKEYTLHLVRAINNALMDFASLVDLKNASQIDWETYTIKSGKFYETRGSLEPIETKISQSFPIPDATIVVILHKDHQIYYSAPNDANHAIPSPNPALSKKLLAHEGYLPFMLRPALHRDIRKYVQEFFREQYGLELSVRPIHKKWFSEDGKPYIAVNAQVQTGTIHFQPFIHKKLYYDQSEISSHSPS